jgi:hypothetical protein
VTEEIIWKDPPMGKNRGGVWVKRLSPLMEHPGRWALVHQSGNSSTITYLKRRITLIPDGEWEFKSRRIENGRTEIYARYLGPTEEGE